MPITNSLPFIGGPIIGGTSGSILYIDSNIKFAQNNSNLFWDNASTRLGLLTTAPSNTLSFGGEAARTVAMERRTTSNVAGNSLTLQSGGATLLATNKAGGALILASGNSTGNAVGGAINFQISPAGTSGTGTNSLQTVTSLTSQGVLTVGLSTLSSRILLNSKILGTAGLITQATTGMTGSDSQTGLSIVSSSTSMVDGGINGLNVEVGLDGDATSTTHSGVGMNFLVSITGQPAASAIAMGGLIFWQTNTNAPGGSVYTAINPALSVSGTGIIDNYIGFSPQVVMAGGTTVNNIISIDLGAPDTSGGGAVGTYTGLKIQNAAISGITTAWSIYCEGGNSSHLGNFKFGANSAPGAKIDIEAGTATANTAPLKFTSGTSLTSAVAGVMEFTTDDLFFTITTGTARKRLLMADAVGGLTSGKIPVATTNGRLADLTASSAYTPTNVTTDRSYDADTVVIAELADVVGSIIADLQAKGILG